MHHISILFLIFIYRSIICGQWTVLNLFLRIQYIFLNFIEIFSRPFKMDFPTVSFLYATSDILQNQGPECCILWKAGTSLFHMWKLTCTNVVPLSLIIYSSNSLFYSLRSTAFLQLLHGFFKLIEQFDHQQKLLSCLFQIDHLVKMFLTVIYLRRGIDLDQKLSL